MKIKIRHICLILGMISFLLSFLWFGRDQEMYEILLIGGLAVTTVSYFWILAKTDSIKNKLIWSTVLIAGIFINRLIEPMLIDWSYLIYLNGNEKELSFINNKLHNYNDDIIIMRDTIITKNVLSDIEKQQLQIARGKIGAYIITKSQDYIYYGLWGFLDVRLGISYYPDESKIKLSGARRIKENWYH